MPYKISPNPQLGAAAGALTARGSCPHAPALPAHGSCPHAIPHYSLNKRALLPDLESPRNLSFDSSAHRPRINVKARRVTETLNHPGRASFQISSWAA